MPSQVSQSKEARQSERDRNRAGQGGGEGARNKQRRRFVSRVYTNSACTTSARALCLDIFLSLSGFRTSSSCCCYYLNVSACFLFSPEFFSMFFLFLSIYAAVCLFAFDIWYDFTGSCWICCCCSAVFIRGVEMSHTRRQVKWLQQPLWTCSTCVYIPRVRIASTRPEVEPDLLHATQRSLELRQKLLLNPGSEGDVQHHCSWI